MNSLRRIEAYQFFNMLPKIADYNIYYNRYDLLYRYDSQPEVLNSKGQSVSILPALSKSTSSKSVSNNSCNESIICSKSSLSS